MSGFGVYFAADVLDELSWLDPDPERVGVKEDDRGGTLGGASVEVELRAVDEIDSLASSSSGDGAGCKVRVGV